MNNNITKINNSKFVQSLAGQFDDYLKTYELSHEVKKLQERSMQCFTDQGLPTQKHEDYKYTKLAFLNNYDFKVNNLNVISKEIAEEFAFKGLEANILFFLNGSYLADFSKIIDEGIVFNNLNEDLENTSPEFLEEFGKSIDICNDPFLSLNTAFFMDGVNLTIEKNKKIEHAIHIVQIFDGRVEENASFPRTFIRAEESSEAFIIETFHKIGEEVTFSSQVSEVFLAENARLEYAHVQILPQSHFFIGKTFISQNADSFYNDITLSLEGKFIRNNLYAKHCGSNVETHYNGFYFASQKNYIDNHTFIEHAEPNCSSNEVYKGIISDEATAVFNGKILVRPQAQKINAYQSNKNILLSDTATINTKPELEIYADDVKCSHGATSGSLDEEHLFYLISRGISPEAAKGLLLSAFGEEIIDKIKIETIREQLSDIFEEKLAGKMQ